MGGGACESVQNQFFPFALNERLYTHGVLIHVDVSLGTIPIFLSIYLHIYRPHFTKSGQRARNEVPGERGRSLRPIGGGGEKKKKKKVTRGELVVCWPKRLPTQRGSFGSRDLSIRSRASPPL